MKYEKVSKALALLGDFVFPKLDRRRPWASSQEDLKINGRLM